MPVLTTIYVITFAEDEELIPVHFPLPSKTGDLVLIARPDRTVVGRILDGTEPYRVDVSDYAVPPGWVLR